MTTLYRYRCFCGHKGRSLADGNLAIAGGEQHVTDPKSKLGINHTYRIYERQADGVWKVMP
jgi:hypothetical protein